MRGYVVDEHGAGGAAVVGACYRAETFLPGGVPELWKGEWGLVKVGSGGDESAGRGGGGVLGA